MRRDGLRCAPEGYCTPRWGHETSGEWQLTAKRNEPQVVTRRDLLPEQPDHPRADQRYYKLSLGKLIELPHPIPSRSLRRITFVLTNGKRLNEAWEINDLCFSARASRTSSGAQSR